MKRQFTQWHFWQNTMAFRILGIFGVAAIIILAGICQSIYSQSEERRIGTPVLEEARSPFWVVSQEFKGPLEKIEENMKVFMKEFFRQGLLPAGSPVGIFHNSPRNVRAKSELKWEIGFPVKEDVKVAKPLKIQQIKLQKLATYTHVGTYDGLNAAYDRMQGFVSEKGYKVKWPVIFRYLNDPSVVKSDEIKTEVLIPLRIE